VSTSAETNDLGEYRLSSLDPGTYVCFRQACVTSAVCDWQSGVNAHVSER